MYSLLFTRGAAKQIRKLEPGVRTRVLAAIEKLATAPRPVGAIKLVGEPAWRIRVGNYRVIYEIEDTGLTVTVIRAVHRREAYS